jgi:hypothetical protein
MRLTASSHSAFARPAQQGTAPTASPMQGFVTLCHLCFAAMPVGGLIAAVGLSGVPMAYRIALFAVGVLLWIAAEGWLAVIRRARPDGAFVSVSIAAGLLLVIAGWLIALNVI